MASPIVSKVGIPFAERHVSPGGPLWLTSRPYTGRKIGLEVFGLTGDVVFQGNVG